MQITAITTWLRVAPAQWHMRAKSALRRRPWLHWGVVYAFGLVFFLCYRLLALDAIVHTFGAKHDDTLGNQLLGLLLGLCEDVVCVTYMATLLWAFDWSVSRLPGLRAKRTHTHTAASNRRQRVKRVCRFVWYFLVSLVATIHSVANGLLVRIRQMRFTLKFLEMYFNQKDAVGELEISAHEQRETQQTVFITLSVLLVFSGFACVYLDLSLWNPTRWLFRDDPTPVTVNTPTSSSGRKEQTKETVTSGDERKSDTLSDYRYLELEQGDDSPEPHPEPAATPTSSVNASADDIATTDVPRKLSTRQTWQQRCFRALLKLVLVAIALVALPIALLVFVQKCTSPVVAMIGLNTSLSELFRLVAGEELLRDITDGTIASAHLYLDNSTEEYSLLRDDALVRRTTGFKGDLAFDVRVDQANLPNVLVIAVESFRYHDSQYLVGNSTYLLKNQNITVTPNFDRWAKRGIAFRNFWSSWQTSRSLESILFAQLPFDSVTETGTTTGRTDVELAGMPQLFKAKGYEAVFTTGCRTDYDQWSKFLPSHGFDEILNMTHIKRIAEAELGIDSGDWELTKNGGKSRAMRYWGVHDDVSFEVLGNILVNKTDAQKARVKKNEPKRPFFMNFYTITSHTSYEERPQWYENYTTPDFSALYKTEPHGKYVKKYLELRYFTDLALGKFLDRMEAQGILNDTIVMIVGDHGQGPEFGKVAPEYREMSTARVAATLIAEGRLGEHAGSLVDRVGEHYDLLNTLADIVGVPDGGFLQTGVGRSLKRKASTPQHEAQHVVWSNNPVRKMGVVRGHRRLQYDVMTSQVALHDTDADHDMHHDLFPDLPPDEKKEWLRLRDAGRRVSAYFKKRWMKKCLLKSTC